MIETHSLATLITAILQRMGDDIEPDNLPQIMVCIYLKAFEIKRGKLWFSWIFLCYVVWRWGQWQGHFGIRWWSSSCRRACKINRLEGNQKNYIILFFFFAKKKLHHSFCQSILFCFLFKKYGTQSYNLIQTWIHLKNSYGFLWLWFRFRFSVMEMVKLF